MCRSPRFLVELRQYKKIFRSHLSVIVIPLLVAIVLYIIINSLMVRQLEDFGNTKVQHFESEVTGLFREVEIVSNSIANNSIVSRSIAAGLEHMEHGERLELCEELSRYAVQSTFIDRIYILCTDYDQILSSGGLYTDGSLSALLLKIGETPQSFYQEINGSYSSGWHIGTNSVVEPYFACPIYHPDTGRPMGDIIVVLHTHTLSQILARTETSLCCLYDEERYISSVGSGSGDIDWGSEDAVSALLREKVKCFYAVSSDLTYMVAVPSSSFFLPSQLILLCFSSYFVIVIASAIYSSIRASRRNYKHLSDIIEKIPNLRQRDSTGEEITGAIEAALIDYRDNMAHLNQERQANSLSWILGGYLTQPLNIGSLTGAGIAVHCAGYHVATLTITDDTNILLENNCHEENNDIVITILRSALSTIAGNKASVSCCRIRGHFAAVFCHNSNDRDSRDATAILYETVEVLNNNYGLNILVSLSGWIERPIQLASAYEQASELSSFATMVDMDRIFISYAELMREGGYQHDAGYLKQLQILTNTLLLEKYDLVPPMVNKLLEKEIVPLRRNYSLGQSRLHCLSALLAEAVMAGGEKGPEVESYVERLNSAQSVSQLADATNEVFHELQLQNVTDLGANAVDRGRTYIHKHLDNVNLTIPDVCEAAGVSVQHLSRLFRKQLNQTISEYINELRINRAKELLSTGQMTVGKIAQMVGYGSSDAFYRNFKKNVGITPAEYARMSTEPDGR